MAEPVLELWYEFASTYSYPAAMRAERVAADHGLRIAWKPFLLGPIFNKLGWETSPFNLQPAKGEYMWRDMERTCQSLGLPFRRPDPFPQHSLQAARIATALSDDGSRSAFSRAVYCAEFGEGGDVSDPALLKRLLTAQGLEASQILTQSRTPEIKAQLRKNTETAIERGIFGAPTWRTADGEIFWGNDRLEAAIDWSKRPNGERL